MIPAIIFWSTASWALILTGNFFIVDVLVIVGIILMEVHFFFERHQRWE